MSSSIPSVSECHRLFARTPAVSCMDGTYDGPTSRGSGRQCLGRSWVGGLHGCDLSSLRSSGNDGGFRQHLRANEGQCRSPTMDDDMDAVLSEKRLAFRPGMDNLCLSEVIQASVEPTSETPGRLLWLGKKHGLYVVSTRRRQQPPNRRYRVFFHIERRGSSSDEECERKSTVSVFARRRETTARLAAALVTVAAGGR